ncbi:MAG: DUF983 domain-containing protein [Deltaproteobacteria bacterium]|nr:DUF983 domain-containing protein [Deltaproteobacteria bacterium]
MGETRIVQLLARGILLRCPRCGKGSLFYGFFSMHRECPHCALKFEREQGYFVGAIYINYAATILIVMPGYFILDSFTGISFLQQMLLWIPFAVLFPLFFFRHSRSLWLTLDCLFNPPEVSESTRNVRPLRPAGKREAGKPSRPKKTQR